MLFQYLCKLRINLAVYSQGLEHSVFFRSLSPEISWTCLFVQIHVQCPYIEMKKFFFFRTSSNDVNNIPSAPSKDKSSDNIDKSKNKKEVSSPSLRRSVSLSSGSFYDSGLGQRNFRDPSRSPCHSKRAHPKKSGRDPCRRYVFHFL